MREMVDSAMIGRSPRLRLAVLVTRLCACGADLAVCAAAGDVRSGDPWLRVGNLLRDVVRHVRSDHRERASRLDDSRPPVTIPANPDTAPPSDRESGH
jgi:hypothetical protein